MAWLPIALVCLLVGCPSYNDKHSGTYREPNVDPASQQEAVQVDLFRYGDHAKAVLRYFEPSVVRDEAYADEIFCTETWSSKFQQDGREFDLPIKKTSRIGAGTMLGKVRSDNRLEIEIFDEKQNTKILESTSLERIDKSPNEQCDAPEDFLIRPIFTLRSGKPNELSKEVGYDIQNPVFTVQWVGLQQVDRFLAPVNAQGPTRRLGKARFDKKKNRFKDSLPLTLPAPPEKVRVDSGGTSFSIGHVVVVDDIASEGRFSWDVGSEPIVASSIQAGRSPAVAKEYDHDATGRAILFVEGKLEELAAPLRNARIGGEEAVAESELPDRHFFLVDIYVDFALEEIVRVNIVDDPAKRKIWMQATDRYLGEDSPGLPRLLQ